MAMWTAEQQRVISDRGCSLLVAAGAGSGKTAVLVERIIGLATDAEGPADIDRILVVTFTQAAASEMRERIRTALSRLAAEGDAAAGRQLELLPRAPISTIHSFCMNLLRSHFHLLGLDPGFRIGDAAECELMLHEALDEVLQDRYGQPELPPELADLLEAWSGYRGDAPLRELVMSLHRYSMSAPWPDEWMADSVSRFDLAPGTDLHATEWGKLLAMQAVLFVGEARQCFVQAHALADAAGIAAYLPALDADIGLSERIGEKLSEGWDAARQALSAMTFQNLKPVRGEVDAEAKEAAKALRKKGRERLERIRDELLAFTSEEAVQDLRSLHPRLKALMDLASAMARAYMRLKRRKGIVDFNDLEHMAISLLWKRADAVADAEAVADADAVADPGMLVPTETALAMRSQFLHVLVDEYQDSNMVQELILRAVSTETADGGNLFMVGDVKQSIYRFRQALPELFMEKYGTWPDDDGSARKRILLYRNFRSRPGVLAAVNHVFSRIMSEASGEMDYTERESLIPGLAWDTPVPGMPEGGWPVELHVLMPARTRTDAVLEGGAASHADEEAKAGDRDEEEVPEGLEAVRQEAVWAAEALLRIVRGSDAAPPMQVEERSGGTRAACWRDTVILLRSTAGRAQVFVEELALFGIPAFADGGSGYFTSTEIALVICWLRVLDNPLQDIPLASVLRSFLYGFTETELLRIRTRAQGRSLHDALLECADAADLPDSDETLSRSCRAYVADWRRWRALSGHVPIRELLWRFYHETGLLGRFGSMPNGTVRTANLRLLLDRAARFSQTGLQGLYQFIRFIDRMVERRGDSEGARVLGEADDVVRIMSIHKSKGLEFPVVLLCGTGTRFNRRDLSAPMLMHQRLGWGPDVVRTGEGVRYPSAAKLALRFAAHREMVAEEMRILYVAMTRARERLLICGRGAEAPVPGETAETPAPSDVLSMRSHLEMIASAVRSGPLAKSLFLAFSVDPDRLARLHADRTAQPETGEPRSFRGPMGFAEIDAVRAAFEWRPDRAALSGIPAKATVTGIKRAWDEALFDGSTADLSPDRPAEASAAADDFQAAASSWADELSGGSLTRANELSAGSLTRADELPAESSSGANDLPAVASSGSSGQLAEIPSGEGEMKSSTVSESIPERLPYPMPAFLRRDGGGVDSGTAYGSLMHLAVQNLNPASDRGDAALYLLLDRLVAESRIAEADRRRIGIRSLRAWMASDLYARMGASVRLRREDAFTVRIPACDAFPGAEGCTDETVVLQGVIDCWFEEPDGLVVVDFKTDRDLTRLDEYRAQLGWYARALRLATRRPVKECWIWSFHENIARAVSVEEERV